MCVKKSTRSQKFLTCLNFRFPSALIVGVRKGGTRALLDAIALHPKVRIVRRETHFFDSNYTLGFDWYRDQMPEVENDNEVSLKANNYHKKNLLMLFRLSSKKRQRTSQMSMFPKEFTK